jgi:hypothetical protein
MGELAVFGLVLLCPMAASAQPTRIADVLANPMRFVNRTISVAGQVQATSASPAGTTRGAYALVDDSGPTPIMVRTSDLPAIGQTLTVVGVVVQDPAWPAPFLRETSRSGAQSGGGSSGPVTAAPPGPATQALVADILANPPRFWNRSVALVGDVQSATANPAGTTRGTYTLLDDSSTTPITVRSTDLPPLGRTFSVIGTVIQDPVSGQPILKETKRTSAKR